MRIEFIYDRDCPNVADARVNLRGALAAAGVALHWREWERADPASPDYARRYGSPTILVDGRDIAGMEPTADPSCRIYSMEPGRQRGVPSVAAIVAALQRAQPRRTAARILAALPVVGAALLPKLTCPACWPAYAGLLSALGVGFVDYTPYLLPLTAVFLLVTLWTLAQRARTRRGYGPLGLGLASAAVILVGKFGYDADAATYGGVALLVVAAVWNSWPRRASGAHGCTSCALPR